MADENEDKLNRYKDRLTNALNDKEANRLLQKLKAITVTFSLLKRTQIIGHIRSWISRNESRVDSHVIKQAEKLISRWKEELQRDDSSEEQSSDDSSSDEVDVKQEVEENIYEERVDVYCPANGGETSPVAYSPGGGDASDHYVPSNAKKKPYRPGAFFLDENDVEDDEEDEVSQDFIADEDEDEEDEEEDNPYVSNGRPKFVDDDDEDLVALLEAENDKFNRETLEVEERGMKQEAEYQRQEEKAVRRAQKELQLKMEQKMLKEKRKHEQIKHEQREMLAKKRLAEKRKLDEEEDQKRRAKKRKLQTAEAEKIMEEKAKKARRSEKEREKLKKIRMEKKIKSESNISKVVVKKEPVIDPFGSSDSESEPEDSVRYQPPMHIKTEVKTEPSYDVFDSDNDDDTNNICQLPNKVPLPPLKIKEEPNGKKKKMKVPESIKLADKSKKRKKEEKRRKKTNLTVKSELDTDKFSFEAMMTMNTAKVKKQKKIKAAAINEFDESVLEFGSKATPTILITAKEKIKKQKVQDLTDADAALLATTRKKGGYHMMTVNRKIKYVSRVYSLFELSQKMLKNYPEYVLAPHCFLYPADIIMPAMEKLNAKCLHKLEKMQPHLCEDTNNIWRELCILKFGKKSAETVEGSGDTWKEGYTRLSNESEAKLKLLTKKIGKKVKKSEQSTLNTKLAFVTGTVKAPRNILMRQKKHGTGNDIRNKKFDVHVPGVTNIITERYTATSGSVRHDRAPVSNQVNIQSDTQRQMQRSSSSAARSQNQGPKKPAPLMMKALRGLKGYRK